jgi:hypothetical protein
MEPIATMTLPGGYKATVNESETITDAQTICLFQSRSETSEPQAFGFRFPVPPYVERS